MELNKTKFYKTTTFDVDSRYFNGFKVDIVEIVDEESPQDKPCITYEAWLYHKDIGVKDLMFGAAKDNTTFAEMTEMVLNNLKYETYFLYYIKDHVYGFELDPKL